MNPRPVVFILVLSCAWSLPLAADAPATHAFVRSWTPDGSLRWAVDLDRVETEGRGVALAAPEWFPTVPDEPLISLDPDGEPLPGPRGTVTLLDFWASWCAPCIEELPHLETIHRRLADAGLRVVAVNVDDPPERARSTARELGLSMDVVRPGPDLLAFARPRSLPTLLLTDAEGRVRLRWDGYRPGMEHEVERAARRLLGDPTILPPDEVARVGIGADAWAVVWARDLGAEVSGVAVHADGPAGRVFAAVGRDLVALSVDDGIDGRAPAPAGTGRIVLGDVTGDERTDLVGWRHGAERIGVLDLERRAAATWAVDAPVLAVAVVPPEVSPGGARLVVATTEGLRFLDGAGRVVARGNEAVSDVALDGAPGLHALRTTTVDALTAEGTVAASIDLDAPASAVAVPVPETVIVGGAVADLIAAAPGVVVVREPGDVVEIDADGRVRWAARWQAPVAQVALGDLDGDGRDELVVASGTRVVVLKRPGAP